jgi:hypothetical protein
MRKLILGSLLFALMLLSLSACDGSTETTCTPSDLEPPHVTSPGPYYNVGTAPTTGSLPAEFFQWEFDPDCTPEHFKIQFSTDRYFGLARTGMTDGELTWPPSGAANPQAPLEPATEYFWNVRAWTEGINGPESGTWAFFTGPECGSAGELGAPELLSPEPGEVLDQIFVELHYQVGEPKCVPEGYLVDLQADPGFSGTNLLTSFSFPGTYVMTEELTDCTTYYWRVAPLYGGAQGPFSETRAFNVRVDPSCPITSQVPELDIEVALPNILCDPQNLPAPELTWPPHNSQVGTSEGPPDFLPAEFFQWEAIDCLPEKYKLRFSEDPDWGIARVGMTEGETVWPSPDAEYPQIGLEPATEYFWNVRAWTEGINGPDSPTWVFFTGPTCDLPDDLVAPELLEPSDGVEVPALEVTLNFEPGEPGCIPDGYYLDLQTVPDFSGTNPYAGDWGSKHSYMTISDLQDCTTYYWRIAQVEDATFGPFSESRSFFTNQSGNCAQSLVPEIVATRDLACYQGPDPQSYPIYGYLLSGESSPIVAQSLNQSWWYIQNPDGPEICAVPKDGGDSRGDTGDIPMWNDPENEPEEEPLTCKKNLNKSQCEAAGGTWMEARVTAESYCECD